MTAVMPAFLVGASSVFLRSEFAIDEGAVGIAIGAFFTGSALLSVAGGRLAETLGPRRSIVTVAVADAVVLLAIGVLVRSLTGLIVSMGIAGAINGMGQPATNLALARSPSSNTALSFGIKQAAVPAATLLAGLAVPLLGVHAGWRWVFASGAVFPMAVAILAATVVSTSAASNQGVVQTGGDASRPPLVAMAIAVGVGAAAATSLGAFLVDSAIDVGFDIGSAGLLLSAGSVAGIATRISVGWLADTGRGSPLLMVATMLGIGALAFALLGEPHRLGFIVGAVLAVAAGWGWAGLLYYAVVQLNPEAPGVATGIITAGMASGAALGPPIFGMLITEGSFQTAWRLAAGAAVLSAVLLLLARSWLVADRDRRLSEL